MKKIIYTLFLLPLCHNAVAQNENAYEVIKANSQFSCLANAMTNQEYFYYICQPEFPVITIAPNNKALEKFVDPVSYYTTNPQVWKFALDETQSSAKALSAQIFNCTIDEAWNISTEGSAVKTYTGANSSYMDNRLKFILDNSTIMGFYVDGKKFYKTRGNSYVKIEGNGGSYRIYNPVTDKYISATAYNVNNGLMLEVEDPIIPNYKSVALRLAEKPEFSDFLWAMENSGALSKFNVKDSWLACDQAYGNMLNIKDRGMIGSEDVTSNTKVTYLLNGYHYTIYAPTNAAMQMAFNAGLPDSDDLMNAELLDEKEGKYGTIESHADSIREVLLNFVKYHIQDDAVFIDNGSESGQYDSGKSKFLPATNMVESSGTGATETVENGYYLPGAPYKLNVNVSSTGLTVTDAMGNTRNVVRTDGMYNIMAQEYWSEGTNSSANPYSVSLDNSSFVVIHAIDGPLLYDAPNQFKYEYKKLVRVE